MSTKTTKRKRVSAAAVPAKAVAERPTTAVAEPIVAAPVAAAVPTPVAEPIAVSVAASSAEPIVGLSSNCTVKDAVALKSELVQLLETSETVAIDASSVERIDTAIMQLLCAFVRDRAERNLGVSWRGTPQALRDAARLLGVGALLALPAEAAP